LPKKSAFSNNEVSHWNELFIETGSAEKPFFCGHAHIIDSDSRFLRQTP